MNKFIFLISGIFLLYSCSNTPEKIGGPTHFEKIINKEAGHFRGFSIGDKLDFVLKNESSALADSASDYLFYDSNLNDSDYFNVSYQFDDSGLFEIMLDVSFNNQPKTKKLYADLLSHFSNKYGPAQKIDNFEMWKTKSDKSNKIEFALSQDSTENGEGHILFTITNYDY